MPLRQAAFRADFRLRVARLYSGPLHVVMIFTIGAAIIWYGALNLEGLVWYEWLIVPVVFAGGNLFEWSIHRFVMHRPIKGFGNVFYAIYARHTLAHHQFFTNHEPTIDSLRDFRIVFFPPYALVVIVSLLIPGVALFVLVGIPNVGWLMLSTSGFLYLNYELFHYACHVKSDRVIRYVPLINTIRRHHIAHHDVQLMMEKNFNLTYPFADWMFKTSDLDRGPLGHLLNGYSTKHVSTERRRIIGAVDDLGVGLPSRTSPGAG